MSNHMSNADKEKKLEKLKKILALTKSSNPHEAASALEKAQAYMQKHHISDLDVELADCGMDSFTLSTKKPPNWVLLLADLIRTAFGCDVTLGSTFKENPFNPKRTMQFIGISPDQELAVYSFEVLYEQLKQDRLAFVKAQPKQCKAATKRGRGDAFAENWCLAVETKVKRLVVSDTHQALITRYKNEVIFRGKPSKAYIPRDTTKGSKFDNSRGSGYAAGQKAQLNTPVNGRATPQLSHNR